MIIDWLARLAVLVAIVIRKPSAVAQAWMPLLLVFPIPGILVFFWGYRPFASVRRRRRLTEARRQLKAARRRIVMSRHCVPPELPLHLERTAKLVENINMFPAVGGNSIELLADYKEVINRLVADIATARHHIHLTTYIFSDDAVGGQIINALRAAAARGVECRILIDALGSYWWSRRVIRELRACGIEVRRALPVSITNMEALRPDLRNHRKLVVIDGKLGYIGSQNIIGAVQTDGRQNKELMVRVLGPIMLQLQSLFANDWFLETGELLGDPALFPVEHSQGTVHAQLVAGGPEYRHFVMSFLLDAIVHAAEHSLVITTPYFVPDEALVLALESAALRGVNVSLILPEKSDHRVVDLAQRSFFVRLLESGVVIHLYGGGFLHAKHVHVDDELSLVGSMNIDLRSLKLNGEAGLLIYDRSFSSRLGAQERQYMAESQIISLKAWRSRSSLQRLAENIARLFSPVL
ncbi:cardiolipin synthase [Aurantiacibacter atlanticus]|uniref:cardiolipin synthase n=1 Tax=Aurantiacibacter atlanticus TaxID=1648404 RepID=UPI0006628171|nr:cardiolipin synthase [Aurantiacibacter atlanticus]